MNSARRFTFFPILFEMSAGLMKWRLTKGSQVGLIDGTAKRAGRAPVQGLAHGVGAGRGGWRALAAVISGAWLSPIAGGGFRIPHQAMTAPKGDGGKAGVSTRQSTCGSALHPARSRAIDVVVEFLGVRRSGGTLTELHCRMGKCTIRGDSTLFMIDSPPHEIKLAQNDRATADRVCALSSALRQVKNSFAAKTLLRTPSATARNCSTMGAHRTESRPRKPLSLFSPSFFYRRRQGPRYDGRPQLDIEIIGRIRATSLSRVSHQREVWFSQSAA